MASGLSNYPHRETCSLTREYFGGRTEHSLLCTGLNHAMYITGYYMARMNHALLRHRQGFTLIELLVVIAIIGTLSAVVLASTNSARIRSRDARRMADLKQLRNALQMYATNTGDFPSTPIACLGVADGSTCWGDRNVPGNTALNTSLAPYIPALPRDPLPTRGWGDAYIYLNSTVAVACTGAEYRPGQYLLYRPDADLPGATCPMGFFACCPGVGTLCGSNGGYFCAVQM
jgi:type II secretion system protein G